MTVTAPMAPAPLEPIAAGARVIRYPEPPTAITAESAGGTGEPQGRRNSLWYFWTWLVTPHIEFGAIYVGIIAVLFLDMSLAQGLLGVFLGTAFGSFSHGILTSRGIQLRLPQVVMGRMAFGRIGNMVLTTVMALISTVGWFIFNSAVAALALNSLFGLPIPAALAIVVVVQLALSLIPTSFRQIQRYLYPVLTVILIIAGIIVFTQVDPALDPGSPWNLNGIIAVVVVACLAWAYTIGWSPYATDYSDYTPTNASSRAAGTAAGLGLFVSTMFLMSVGIVAGIAIGNPTETNPTTQFTGLLPAWYGAIVLVALIIGSFSHNAIALKSAQHLLNDQKQRFNPWLDRMLWPVALTLLAFFLGWLSTNAFAANYEGFVMVLGFWVGPWLNVALIDHLMRRHEDPTSLLYAENLSAKWGLFAVGFALAGSICLYALQIFDHGRLPHGGVSYAALGMLVGFYLAGAIYAFGLKRLLKSLPDGAAVA